MPGRAGGKKGAASSWQCSSTSGVRRGPVGRRRGFLLLDVRLTARPKHPDFRERTSLRGAVKERRSSVGSENVRKGFQPSLAPGSMTKGVRSFRRRGANAHRSPGDGACQKQAAERGNSVGPSLGGFGPCCFLGAIPESSVIALGGELAVARRHRFPRSQSKD